MPQNSRPDSAASAQNDGFSVADQIKAHETIDKHESLLHRGLSAVWDGGADKSLAHLQKLQQEVNDARTKGDTNAVEALKKKCAEAVTADKKGLESRETYLSYAGGALEMATMAAKFGVIGQVAGILGTAGLYGLDSAKAGDNWKDQLIDGTLGAAKGVGLRSLFQYSGAAGWNPITQGVVTGFTSRFADYATNRDMYRDGFAQGLGNALTQAADWHAMTIDGIAFGAGHGLFMGANKLLGNRLGQSTVARSMISSGALGFTTGTSNEIMREQNAHESFDFGKVIGSGVLQGSLNSVAGLTGEIRTSKTPMAAAHEPLVPIEHAQIQPVVYVQHEPIIAPPHERAPLLLTGPKPPLLLAPPRAFEPAAKAEVPPVTAEAPEITEKQKETPVVAPPPQPQPPQEFLMTSGGEQLNAVINTLRLNRADAKPVVINVQKVTGNKLGEPQQILVQRGTSEADFQKAEEFARANNATLTPLLPDLDRVTMHSRIVNYFPRIVFTPENNLVKGFKPAVTMGEQEGQEGQPVRLHLLEPLPKPKAVPPKAANRAVRVKDSPKPEAVVVPKQVVADAEPVEKPKNVAPPSDTQTDVKEQAMPRIVPRLVDGVPQEFAVTGGVDKLKEMIDALRAGKSDPRSAIIEVRRITGKDMGDPQRMLVQHVTSRQDLQAVEKFAHTSDDVLIAMCTPRLSPEIRFKHVLPYDERITLHTRDENGQLKIAFTPEHGKVEGYEPAVTLGEDSGHASQHYAFESIMKPVSPEDLNTPLGKAVSDVQRQLNSGTWKLFESQTGSAADSLGMDYILLNTKNGQYFFFDATLDEHSKEHISHLRQQGVVTLRLKSGDFRAVTDNSIIGFANRLNTAMKSQSILNTRDIPLPSYEASPSREHMLDEIDSFKHSLSAKIDRLEQSAKTAAPGQAAGAAKAAELLSTYRDDVGKAQWFAKKRVEEKNDPARTQRETALTDAIDTATRAVVAGAIATNTVPHGFANIHLPVGMDFNTRLDQLSIMSTAGRFRFADLSLRVTRTIDSAVLSTPALNTGLHDFLLGDNGIQWVRNQALNKVGIMDMPAILGGRLRAPSAPRYAGMH